MNDDPTAPRHDAPVPFPKRARKGVDKDPKPRSKEENMQVGPGAPRGTRTPNPRIKSPRLSVLSDVMPYQTMPFCPCMNLSNCHSVPPNISRCWDSRSHAEHTYRTGALPSVAWSTRLCCDVKSTDTGRIMGRPNSLATCRCGRSGILPSTNSGWSVTPPRPAFPASERGGRLGCVQWASSYRHQGGRRSGPRASDYRRAPPSHARWQGRCRRCPPT